MKISLKARGEHGRSDGGMKPKIAFLSEVAAESNLSEKISELQKALEISASKNGGERLPASPRIRAKPRPVSCFTPCMA